MGKRLACMLLALTLTAALSACGGSAAAPASSTAGSGSAGGSRGDTLEADGSRVEVTLGAFLVDNVPEDGLWAAGEEAGFLAYRLDPAGSVTYTMIETVRQEKLAALENRIQEKLEGYLAAETAFVSTKHSRDFAQIDIYVDAAAYTAWDNLYALDLFRLSACYQAFSGTADDQIQVVVNFVDAQTRAVVNALGYREHLESIGEVLGAAYSGLSRLQSDLPLAVQQEVTIPDACTFSVEYARLSRDVEPARPGSTYSHYPTEAGKTYLDVCIAYKNLASQERRAIEIVQGMLFYQGSYRYGGGAIMESGDRSDFLSVRDAVLAPLEQGYLHCIFEVPETVADGDGALTAMLLLEDGLYALPVRPGVERGVTAGDPTAVEQSGGAVQAGQVIARRDLWEFYVDFANITADICPPRQGELPNTHYPAESGQVMVDFCVAFRNFGGRVRGAQGLLSAKLIYDGTYEYIGSSMMEDAGRTEFTDTATGSIIPLATEYLHYRFSVPAEVQNSGKPLEIVFLLDGSMYSYQVR